MRILRTIPTPWAPYSVTFSRDGTRLAIGGGSWYGRGGILLVDLASDETRLFPSTDLPWLSGDAEGTPVEHTISGLCFSDNDQFLAASTWRASQSYGPTHVFGLSRLVLTHDESFVDYRDTDRCPTGILLFGSDVITRNHRVEQIDNVITTWEAPEYLRVDGQGGLQHLTSSRVIVARDSIVTGGRERGLTVGGSGRVQETRSPDGLLVVPLGDRQVQETIAVRNGRSITAIAADRNGEGFVTGGPRGQISRWSWNAGWRERPLRGPTNRPRPTWPRLEVTWATYDPNSIVGICSLCDGDGWLSVAADGEASLWERDQLVEAWRLPETGTPRSSAAHPDFPWVAVGIKKGGFRRPESAVVIVETTPLPRYAFSGTWPAAVITLAKALQAGRECRLPLSDALEEAGHGLLAAHFRERKCHGKACWAVGRILESS